MSTDANDNVIYWRSRSVYTPPPPDIDQAANDEFSEMFRDDGSSRRLVLTIAASFFAFVGVVAIAAAAWLV